MSTPWADEGIVTAPPEQTELDGELGIVFWLQSGRQPRTEAARVFVPARHAEQVDDVGLGAGAAIAVGGRLRPDGVIEATTLRPLEPGQDPTGRLIGTVEVRVPDLARLDPWRERGYRLVLRGGLATVVVLGAVGMFWRSWVGNVAFILFLAFCAYLVVDDLRTRKIDDREYASLARDAVGAVRAELALEVPESAMFDMLGGGLERTGNPWRPTVPRRPRRVFWVDAAARARFAADVAPQPLRPDSPATITVTAAPQE
ncbi:hypothetical protein [Intrasporangium flavum]|uniref:hypothetical protein n=1 Tax=Intrasporangium flavum TaxID=1428657 RepID=UPI00096EED50|nr:hypothetical protein [Intrasporangium flavum]